MFHLDFLCFNCLWWLMSNSEKIVFKCKQSEECWQLVTHAGHQNSMSYVKQIICGAISLKARWFTITSCSFYEFISRFLLCKLVRRPLDGFCFNKYLKPQFLNKIKKKIVLFTKDLQRFSNQKVITISIMITTWFLNIFYKNSLVSSFQLNSKIVEVSLPTCLLF